MSYSIKEVSQKFNISPYTLRYYEKEGLIPSVKRNESGRRLYTEDDLGWIQTIDCMRATGMSIAYIKKYADLCAQGEDTISERRKIILDQKKVIEEQLKKYNELLNLVDLKLDYYDEKITRDELKQILNKKTNSYLLKDKSYLESLTLDGLFIIFLRLYFWHYSIYFK
ncbi:MerR family transcriptional regulator [Clostridium sp. 'White wine YQ']|uniref:MerR family transcriptional regulator n=1 Tax=Clostridium sp. 'White wine YQ' TaxID=3027474 RepID=UPI002365198D|nr:MerR family transcriptional regulator [Clostridium sp. 'White wine YQ']MDD7795337.1 MerR family transcriptional regulator [Clostridium sp. 'White wine YQ']